MPSHWRMSLLCSNWAHQPVSLDKLVSVSLLWIQLSSAPLPPHLSLPPLSIFLSLCYISSFFQSSLHKMLHRVLILLPVWVFLWDDVSHFLVLEVVDEERQVLISYSLLSHFVLFAYPTLSCSLSSVFLLISYPFSSHLLPVFFFPPPRPLSSPLVSCLFFNALLFLTSSLIICLVPLFIPQSAYSQLLIS